MPIVELSMVIGTVVGMMVKGVLDEAKHRKADLKARRMLHRRLSDPEPIFDSVYVHTLIEYGIDKPQPLLEFFRYEFVQNSFRAAYPGPD